MGHVESQNNIILVINNVNSFHRIDDQLSIYSERFCYEIRDPSSKSKRESAHSEEEALITIYLLRLYLDYRFMSLAYHCETPILNTFKAIEEV